MIIRHSQLVGLGGEGSIRDMFERDERPKHEEYGQNISAREVAQPEKREAWGGEKSGASRMK